MKAESGMPAISSGRSPVTEIMGLDARNHSQVRLLPSLPFLDTYQILCANMRRREDLQVDLDQGHLPLDGVEHGNQFRLHVLVAQLDLLVAGVDLPLGMGLVTALVDAAGDGSDPLAHPLTARLSD